MELFKVWLFFTSKFDNITSLVKSTKISFAYCSLNTFKFKGFYNSKSQKGWWRGRAVVQTKIVYEMIKSLNLNLNLNLMVKWQRHINYTRRGKGWGFLAGVLKGDFANYWRNYWRKVSSISYPEIKHFWSKIIPNF